MALKIYAFCAMYLCELVYSALVTTQLKCQSALDNAEDALHPGASNIQPRFNSLSKNK